MVVLFLAVRLSTDMIFFGRGMEYIICYKSVCVYACTFLGVGVVCVVSSNPEERCAQGIKSLVNTDLQAGWGLEFFPSCQHFLSILQGREMSNRKLMERERKHSLVLE